MNNENLKKFVSKLSKSKKYGIVYSYADWCEKCKKLNQLEKYKEYEVYYMNVDEDQDLLDLFDIRILPTYSLVKISNNKNSIDLIKQANTLEEILVD